MSENVSHSIEEIDADLLIVGAGPAGLATALRCAPALHTVIVHKDRDVGFPIRTSGGSWLQRLPNIGIPSNCYINVDSLSISSRGERALFFFDRDRPVVFDTEQLFKFLAEKAIAAGAELLTGHTFLSVESEKDGKFISRIRTEGRVVLVRSRYLVDASGYSRVVCRELLGSSVPTRVGVGCELHGPNSLKFPSRAHLVMGTKYFPKGYGWLFPMPKAQFRLGVGLINPDKENTPQRCLGKFLGDPASVERLDPGLTGVQPNGETLHSGVIPADGPWKQVVFGRFVCVGDSCGQNLPTVGEGIRYAIEAGLKLGECLRSTVAGNESRALREYSNWWVDSHLRAFEIGYRINCAITDFSDSQWDKGVRLLKQLDASEVTQLLRLENVPSLMARLLFRKPSIITSIGKHALNHIIGR